MPGETGPVAARIGVGPDNAFENTCALLGGDRAISAVVIVGFAGGLEPGLQPGSVVVGETVRDLLTERTYAAESRLCAAAAEVNPPNFRTVRGLVVSSERVLTLSVEKHGLVSGTKAVAVDMESAAAAAAATEFGVPWLAVRVITDGVDDDLPFDFNAQSFQAHGDPYGGVDRGRIVADALLHPWKIPALIRLGMRSSLASRNLAAFLHALLPRIRDL